jgi:hypothetical protein
MLISIVFVILETSFFSVIFGNEVNPNVIIAFCFAYLVLDELDSALLSAIVFGTAYDIFSLNLIGVTPVFLVLTIYLTYILERNILRGRRYYYLVLPFATYFYSIIHLRYLYFSQNLAIGIFLTFLLCLFFTFVISNYSGYKSKTKV